MVRNLLRLEALGSLLLFLFLYQTLKGSWLLFLGVVLLPDLSMVGYLLNKKIGATLYNLFHNYVLSLALVVFGFWVSNPIFIYVGLIFCVHVSLDRFFGFGLKYPSNFRDTHLEKV
jgi:hypothetical protein